MRSFLPGVVAAVGLFGCVSFPQARLEVGLSSVTQVQGPAVCGPMGFRKVPLQARWGEYVRISVKAANPLEGVLLVHAGGLAQEPRSWRSEGDGQVAEVRFENESLERRFALDRDHPIDLTLTGLSAPEGGSCEGAVFTVEHGVLVPSIDERAWISELERRGGPELAARLALARAEADARRQAHYAAWEARQVEVSAEVLAEASLRREAHYAAWEARHAAATLEAGALAACDGQAPGTCGVAGGAGVAVQTVPLDECASGTCGAVVVGGSVVAGGESCASGTCGTGSGVAVGPSGSVSACASGNCGTGSGVAVGPSGSVSACASGNCGTGGSVAVSPIGSVGACASGTCGTGGDVAIGGPIVGCASGTCGTVGSGAAGTSGSVSACASGTCGAGGNVSAGGSSGPCAGGACPLPGAVVAQGSPCANGACSAGGSLSIDATVGVSAGGTCPTPSALNGEVAVTAGVAPASQVDVWASFPVEAEAGWDLPAATQLRTATVEWEQPYAARLAPMPVSTEVQVAVAPAPPQVQETAVVVAPAPDLAPAFFRLFVDLATVAAQPPPRPVVRAVPIDAR